MFLSTYLQQILSMSNVAERLQQGLQSRGEDLARQFFSALRDEMDRKRTEPQKTGGAQEGIIHDDDKPLQVQKRREKKRDHRDQKNTISRSGRTLI